MDYFGSLGVCGMFSNRLSVPWGGGAGARDGDGRFEYKTRSQILHC